MPITNGGNPENLEEGENSDSDSNNTDEEDDIVPTECKVHLYRLHM